MALPIRDQVRYWGIVMAVLLLVMWALGDVLMPFLIGGALAYFLDPVAHRLERMGLSRVMATSVISIVALLILIVIFLALIPTLVHQLIALVEAAPEMSKRLQEGVLDRFPELADRTSTLRQTLNEIGEAVKSKGGELMDGLLSSAMGVVSFLMLLVVVPVVGFYLLLDWDAMIARIDNLLPRDHAPVIRRLASEIDHTLAGFLRGQVSVCLILGTFYAIALMAVGLQFGIIVGVIAGTITFIPYIGALVGGALAIGLALFQFWGDWVQIGMVAAIFAVGQFLEGNVLTPRLVGRSVGLHPVWLLLALSIFGALFGFTGMLVAVPVTASIGVLVRYAIERYRLSLLYQGHGQDGEQGLTETDEQIFTEVFADPAEDTPEDAAPAGDAPGKAAP